MCSMQYVSKSFSIWLNYTPACCCCRIVDVLSSWYLRYRSTKCFMSVLDSCTKRHLLTVEIVDFDWAAVGVKECKVAWTSAIQRAPNLSNLTTITNMVFVTWLVRAIVIIVLYLGDCRATRRRTDPRWRWMHQLSQVVSDLMYSQRKLQPPC